jgi:exopolysaccharide production protein ExoQ
MSRPFALLLCLPLIIWLWKRDQRGRPPFSSALWIPLLWFLVLGSRPISWWLGIGGSGSGDLEGNWFDRLLYLSQIFASIYILSKRGIQWGTFIGQNKAIFLFYGFLLLTMFWSPYPFVTFRRWFKDIGAIFVILVILTEQHPLEAIKAIFARCAYIWFPLSEIFGKYFPEIGREYSRGGGAMYSGVTTHKNSLGEIILVVGLVLISELVQTNRPLLARPLTGTRFSSFFKGHHFTILFTLAMGLWLLLLSNSKTSQICLVMGTIIVLGHKLPFFKTQPRRILIVIFTAVPLFLIAESEFQISDNLLRLIGRNSTFTDRTEIWQAIRENPVDPIIGCGYMMYWELHRGDVGFNIKTAHNGYIENYLDGGTLGMCFLIIMLVGVGIRVTREFLSGSEYGRLAFALFAVMLLYNITESIYARRSPLWFAFLLFALEFRRCAPAAISEEANVTKDSWRDEHEAVGAFVPKLSL